MTIKGKNVKKYKKEERNGGELMETLLVVGLTALIVVKMMYFTVKQDYIELKEEYEAKKEEYKYMESKGYYGYDEDYYEQSLKQRYESKIKEMVVDLNRYKGIMKLILAIMTLTILTMTGSLMMVVVLGMLVVSELYFDENNAHVLEY